MQSALRKMGNSTGLILPKPILQALGVATGTSMTLRVEKGEVIATPIKRSLREGWAESAALIAALPENDDELAWLDVPYDDNADWTW
jgi:antitoxin MazE